MMVVLIVVAVFNQEVKTVAAAVDMPVAIRGVTLLCVVTFMWVLSSKSSCRACCNFYPMNQSMVLRPPRPIGLLMTKNVVLNQREFVSVFVL